MNSVHLPNIIFRLYKTDISITMNKRPIVIVATARSGSTAYAHHLGKLHKIKVWVEPSRDAAEFASFQRYIAAGNKDYVVKLISYQLENNEVYQSLLKEDCYKIKLTRANKIDQIVSFYIAAVSNIWNDHDKYARGMQYTTDIDTELINTTIQNVNNLDRLLKNADIKFDEALTYEELIKTINLDNSGVAKIISPSNYELVKTAIEIEYAKQR